MSGVTVKFINNDTEISLGKTMGKIFVAFSPYPKGIPSKAKWHAISPSTEKTARLLSKVFGEIADHYAKENVKKEGVLLEGKEETHGVPQL